MPLGCLHPPLPHQPLSHTPTAYEPGCRRVQFLHVVPPGSSLASVVSVPYPSHRPAIGFRRGNNKNINRKIARLPHRSRTVLIHNNCVYSQKVYTSARIDPSPDHHVQVIRGIGNGREHELRRCLSVVRDQFVW